MQSTLGLLLYVQSDVVYVSIDAQDATKFIIALNI